MSICHIYTVQMCSGIHPAHNLKQLRELLETQILEQPALVCLPESWLAFCETPQQALAQAEESHNWIEQIQQLCRDFDIWLAAGTIAMKDGEGRYYAASLLFNNEGTEVARYNKIHLFDADVADSAGQYRESRLTRAGDDVVTVASPFGRLGLSVCYDVRFPGLYQMMREQGAEVLLVPSAFTTVTGDAHWQTLLRARAIETQCYVVAAAQVGHHENGRQTYGHSLIVSPWGTCLAEASTQVGINHAQVDLTALHAIRQKMPVAAHNRFKSDFYE
ncbi:MULTISPECIES: carbon-nitrogen hydrolase family protein [unclassified Pseudoalteromonas]|uniref:carbon-nitrogen hydrolase family protein n=1 Tax=unclassified Pseudoalteromonas TaxID=194690 RepID=UPI0020974A78|nr:carbon-nitrogen hydrolase family protein [Pseudoalteromonas sp. XMcav2-N]MCO7189341.1 carbon-nitrogen hydrolase family protein [Pseudoalteromonas sp. XMcav2-N]